MNCLGEKNILYNLQSEVSFFNNDILLINFDENTTSEIIFDTSRESFIFRKKDISGLNAGVIVSFILVVVFVLAVVILVFFREKLFRRHSHDSQESALLI